MENKIEDFEKNEDENEVEEEKYEDNNNTDDENMEYYIENIQTTENDPSASFFSEITDGNSFKNLIEFLRLTNKKGNFRITPTKIIYEQSDVDDKTSIINHVEIYASELACYEFKAKNDFIIGVDISDIRVHTKGIGKKDSIRLYKNADDQFLYIQILSNNSRFLESENINMILPKNGDVLNIEYCKYESNESNPDCKIIAASFSRLCSSMTALKSEYVILHCSPGEIIFDGVKPGNTSSKVVTFKSPSGQIPYSRNDDDNLDKFVIPKKLPKIKIVSKTENKIVKLKIKSGILKSLSKLNNLSVGGNLKFFYDVDKPLKIVCQIGNYGILRTYIKSE